VKGPEREGDPGDGAREKKAERRGPRGIRKMKELLRKVISPRPKPPE
jgi:hypothetical protein